MRPRSKAFGAIWLFLVSAPVLFPQSAGEFAGMKNLAEPWSVRTWQTEDGLPINGIDCVTQTKDGYIWLGTEEGLIRFDGVRFTVYDTGNTKALPSNVLLALMAAKDGGLWIGTNAGLCRLKDGVFTAFPDTGESVLSVHESRDGTIRFGTNGGGLYRLDPGAGAAPRLEGFSGDIIMSMGEDTAGTLWVGTRDGLKTWKDGVSSAFRTKDGLSHDFVRTVLAGRDGTIWAGTNGGGLNRLKDGVIHSYRTDDGLSNESVLALAEDPDGGLWIGTNGGGLNCLKDGKFSRFGKDRGLSSELVRCLLLDGDGVLWAGTTDGGIDQLLPAKIPTLGALQGLSSDIALALLEDSRRNIWIGTAGGGLNLLRDGVIRTFTTRDGLPNTIILSLCEGADRSLWIGTAGGGLTRYANGAFRTWSLADGLSSNIVQAIREDREGTLWIGTNGGGLNRFRKGVIEVFDRKNGLSSGEVTCLLEDKQGVLWIGTSGGGLDGLKDGRFVAHYTRREGLSTDHVLCLHADPEGTLWIGTAGGGLARLRDGRLSAVTSREGLFDDNVFSILDDGRGHFWMSSNKGLFRVPKSEIEDVADGRRNSVTSYPYGKADGMKSAECNGGVQPAGWKMADGSLWFPTMAGAVAVDPEEMVRPAPPPRLVLEEILVDHSPLPPGSLTRPLALLAGKKSLEFRYTAFAWAAPKDVVFRHKLSGIDDDWVEAGERRTAYYTNIGHGRYTLEIRAGDGMGRWNPQGVDLAISIKPSFMQTPVFFGLCLLALGALAWAVFQVRTQYVLDRKLKILVHERTRELKLEVQERVRAQEAERQSFTRISKNLKDVIDALSKAMESRDPYTQNHQSRVSILVSAIAREMGLPEDAIEGLRVTSVLHDIGKINVPAEFLSSPRKLTEYEYESVKIHSQVGADILSGIDFPWPVAETVLQHHERMDGSGYPRGLRGDEITPWARILAVADVVEAMSSHRPYRPAFDRKEVLAEIRENREKLYDAGATDACLDLFENKGFSFD